MATKKPQTEPGAEADPATGVNAAAPPAGPDTAQAAQALPASDAFPAIETVESPLALDLEAIREVPVRLTVELGRCRTTIRELLQLGQGSVLELDNEAGSSMDVYVNGYLIAQGEVVVVNEHYGIRLTSLVTAEERLAHLATESRT